MACPHSQHGSSRRLPLRFKASLRSRYCLLSRPLTGIGHRLLRARVSACTVLVMILSMRPVYAATTGLSLLFLAACGGGGQGVAEPADVPAPVVTEGGVSDGGGGVVEGPGDASGTPGEVSTGSALGDANRGEYLLAYAPEDLEGITWAGDVNTGEGAFIEYPDGLRIDFAGVEPGSAPISEEEGGLDPDKSLVRVTVTVSNTGPDVLPLDGGYDPFNVFEGENLTEVSSHVGYFGEETDLYSENLESVVAPGSELDVYASFEVEPGAPLEVELNTDFIGQEHTPFVFYGITAP